MCIYEIFSSSENKIRAKKNIKNTHGAVSLYFFFIVCSCCYQFEKIEKCIIYSTYLPDEKAAYTLHHIILLFFYMCKGVFIIGVKHRNFKWYKKEEDKYAFVCIYANCCVYFIYLCV